MDNHTALHQYHNRWFSFHILIPHLGTHYLLRTSSFVIDPLIPNQGTVPRPPSTGPCQEFHFAQPWHFINIAGGKLYLSTAKPTSKSWNRFQDGWPC